jgi:hypothetical protein
MKSSFCIIGFGIVVFALLAVLNTLCGFRNFGFQSFGPNFTSAMVGGGLGGAISLVVVLVSFLLQLESRSRALEPARYLFLREDGEELKESYIAFIDTLRISGNHSTNLSSKSWQALSKEAWPDINVVNLVQKDVETSRISGLYEHSAILLKYTRLQDSIEEIVHSSATAIFEGKENLVQPVLWEAEYNIHTLRTKLDRLINQQIISQQIEIDLSPIETPMKEMVISAGKLLINLCKLSKGIKLE